MDKEIFIDPKSIRVARRKYSSSLKNILEGCYCPFCIKNIKLNHKKPIFRERNWLVTENMFPYTKNKHHLLFIAKRHVCRIEDLRKNEWRDLFELVNKYMKNRKIKNGGFFVKFGNTTSIKHLHFHVVQDTRISKVVI